MARVTRIVLDLALVSITKIRPAVAKVWGTAKSAIVQTKAKPLVSNIVVNKVEVAMNKVAEILETAITSLRDKQLPREEKYLSDQLDKVRQRMSSAVRPRLGAAWQYARVEMIPPMTASFFHGPGGKALENSVAKSADGFISGLQKKIKDSENAIKEAMRAKEAALKAAEEKVKAEAIAKEKERKRVAEETQKKAEKEAKVKAEAKAKEEAKKPEKPKSAPAPAQKKDEPKKKPPAKK